MAKKKANTPAEPITPDKVRDLLAVHVIRPRSGLCMPDDSAIAELARVLETWRLRNADVPYWKHCERLRSAARAALLDARRALHALALARRQRRDVADAVTGLLRDPFLRPVAVPDEWSWMRLRIVLAEDLSNALGREMTATSKPFARFAAAVAPLMSGETIDAGTVARNAKRKRT